MGRLTDIKDIILPKRIFTDYLVLWQAVRLEIERLGNDADLNHFDVSQMTNLHALFASTKFNGDVSGWDVSNVEVMHTMFAYTPFDGDISLWDTHNLINASSMFLKSDFSGRYGIGGWDMRNVKNAQMMFSMSKFNSDVSGWQLDNIQNMTFMFFDTPMSYSVEALAKYVKADTEVGSALGYTRNYKFNRCVFTQEKKKRQKEQEICE